MEKDTCDMSGIDDSDAFDDEKTKIFEKKVDDRFEDLIICFEGFRETENRWAGLDLRVEYPVLFHAIRNYFHDVRRIKLFHPIEKIDQTKIAAHTLKWLLKFRPIRVNTEGVSLAEVPRRVLFVNEEFAVYSCFVLLGIPPRALPDKIVQHLMYSLHFRPIEGEVYSLITLMMQMMSPSEGGGSYRATYDGVHDVRYS